MPTPKALEADATKPIQVSANASIIDTLTAAGRLALVVIGAVPILLKLLGAHDFLALVAYFRSTDGATLIAAVSGLAAIGYGLYKSHKRGNQLATAAADPRVDDDVLTIKGS